ncbi:MAG: fibronectin type III domain-containing protein [Patescibacteria group bacterium]
MPINSDSVTVNWTTDSVANAEVEYGTTAGYGDLTPLDTSLSLTHSVTLTGLTANTEYHYRIRTADEIGNTAASPDNTFTTASITSGTPVSGYVGYKTRHRMQQLTGF